jgi:hypothetical protein
MKSELSIYHIVVFFVVIILLVFIFQIANSEILNPPHPGMSIIKFNENGIPPGIIVHLTDEDFTEYRFLAEIIRDNSQPGDPNEDGTRIGYSAGLSWNEYNRFMGSKFHQEHYAINEYNGSRYLFFFTASWENTNMTITKIFEIGDPGCEIVQIHEEDFSEFPYLVPIIRGKSQEGVSNHNGTNVDYFVNLSMDEKRKITASKFFSQCPVYYEYKNRYYSFGVPWIS